jgi:hypothetical protein
MAGLARMSKQTSEGLAQLALWKWEGKAKSWWIVLPPNNQAFIMRDWHTLLQAIRSKFLDATWIHKREQEFEEMKFQQRRNKGESPEEFLHCRILYNSFLYPDIPDGPGAVTHVLYTQPTEWNAYLNGKECPTIFQLLEAASNLEEMLLSLHLVMESSRTQTTTSGQPSKYIHHQHQNDRNMNLAIMGGETKDESEEVVISSQESVTSEETDSTQARGANTVENFKCRNTAKPLLPCWPEGKTINSHYFPRC